MNAQDLEAMKILEEIAQELDKGSPWVLYRQDLAKILRGVAALRQQPAPVDLDEFREAVRAVDDFIFHRDRCGFPHQICDCGMKEARVRLLSIIELCPCGEATCTESWEPGCGLGESVEHAVPAEREPPRGDELRAILARQPAPVVDDELPGMWSQSDFTGGATDAADNARQPAPVAEDAMAGVLAALKDARTFVTHAHCQIAAPIGTLEKYDAATAAVNELIEVAAQIKARLDARRAKAFAERGGWQWHSREDEGDYERLCAALARAQGVQPIIDNAGKVETAGVPTDGGLAQRGEAWLKVAQALNWYAPWWLNGEGTGREKAVAAIKKMAKAYGATQPAPVVDDAMVDAAIAAQDAHWANDANYPARAPRSVKGDAALHDKLARGAMRAALTAAIARAQGVQPIIDNAGKVECAEVSGYIATVPDKCDRIIWHGQYHHLPPHQPAPVVDDAMVEWKPRNRTEAAALAKIALAHLGVVDAYIDNAIARMETDAARAQEVQP